jgi:hypothetical protein
MPVENQEFKKQKSRIQTPVLITPLKKDKRLKKEVN